MLGQVKLWIGCAVLVASVSSSASAQVFGQGGLVANGSPGGYGLGFFNFSDQGINTPRLPYYALYPPVYYSYVVPRPYGFSPFAYPPGVMTPDMAPPAAAGPVMFNPHVKPQQPMPTEDKSASVDKAASAPRLYLSPFVKQSRVASSAPLAKATD